jgi:lipid-A-disaccharide synthase
MKYYLIVGEASGDLHASNLMKSLQREDAEAEFRFFGGDLMTEVGGTRVKHYKELAYMGFVPVLMHLPTILSNMRRCKRDILQWKPDVVILVDYPSFNLSVARYVKRFSKIPVFYYISPKVWAWKEYRVQAMKRDIDEIFSILPFEVDFFRKHQYQVRYVGNPCVDAVDDFYQVEPATAETYRKQHDLSPEPIIALLAGSRKQEIKDNLPDMITAASRIPGHQLVLAGAPGIDRDFYRSFLEGHPVKVVYGETYALLNQARAALVTSGTATLETALFEVPQVVCYHTPLGKLISYLRKKVLKVKYISLVNLIANKEVVRELVADTMTVDNMEKELRSLLFDAKYRGQMIYNYHRLKDQLGDPGASRRAAQQMVEILKKR